MYILFRFLVINQHSYLQLWSDKKNMLNMLSTEVLLLAQFTYVQLIDESNKNKMKHLPNM